MKAWVGLLLLVTGAVFVLTSHLDVRGDITHFLPDEQAGTARSLSRSLATSELPRAMVLSVSAETPAEARRIARELAAEMRANEEVAWARTGPDPELPAALFDLYFPRRHDFLCDEPDPTPCLQRFNEEEGIREALRDLRRRLALPGAGRLAALADRDPFQAFEGIVARVRGTDPGLRLEAGQFVAAEGPEALILLQTHASAFDSERQAPLLGAIQSAFDRESKDSPAVLEMSGVNRFAVGIESRMQADTVRIGTVSLVGVSLLFLIFFRSPAVLVLALLPGGLGILGALLLATALQGELDLLTLAFGASLTGVAIDYAIHLIHHQTVAGTGRTPQQTARHLRPSLLLGAGTTLASFAGLTLTDFPGFREMGFFAMAGIAIAVLTTLFVLPKLLGEPRAPSPWVLRLAAGLGSGLQKLRRHRRGFAVVPLLALVSGLWAWPHAEWSDDLRGLSEIDPALVAEDDRVRARLSNFDASRLALVSAPDEGSLLRANDQLFERLQEQTGQGVLAGARSLHAFLWDPERIARHREVLNFGPEWRKRFERIAEEEGFRTGAFAPFLAEVAEAPKPELTLNELLASPLGEFVRPMIFDQGGRKVAVTYLRGVDAAASVDALAAAIAAVPGAELFDQRALIDGMFGEFRATTLRQMGVGSLLVVAVLALRYRRVRPTLAAFLPSVTTALLLLGALVATGTAINLLHAISLLLVMGMGVDYGIFLVDSGDEDQALGATLLSLLVACLTTVFVFGALALSAHPALRAIGVTTGLGVMLCFVLAPISWAAHAEGAGPEGAVGPGTKKRGRSEDPPR